MGFNSGFKGLTWCRGDSRAVFVVGPVINARNMLSCK